MQVSTSKVEHLPSSESNQFYLFPSTDGTGGQGSEVEGFSMGTSISTLGTHDGTTIIHTNTQQRESAKEFSWLDPKSDGTDLLRWSGSGLSFNSVRKDSLIISFGVYCTAARRFPNLDGKRRIERTGWNREGGSERLHDLERNGPRERERGWEQERGKTITLASCSNARLTLTLTYECSWSGDGQSNHGQIL